MLCRSEILAFASAAGAADECPRTAFEAMDRVDMQFLAYASALYLVRFRGAVDEYREAVGDTPPYCSLGTTLVFQTVAGEVRICGPGDDANTSCGALVIDLGGNDSYTSPHELLNPFANPFTAVVDLGGNDRYTDDNKQGSLACGVYGLSVLADLGGNDSYSCLEAGLGAAYFGTGVLIDYAGDDMYASSKGMTQGAAHFGAGVLSDLGGNDDYICGYEGQGFGSTRGVGLLVDVAGNDNYRVSDTAMMSAAFGDRPISFAQGAAFGRRSDFGDGHSLAGGIGILAEGAGNDHYHGAIYCQGTAYWWGLGICEDKAGDDSYRCLWYSLGSAPHFAIGCMVDVKGNDRYNADAKDAVTQYQGCARDGSVGVFVDGDGDDHYFLRNRCAGAADLNSIAVFWDRYGNDIYETDLSSPYQADPPLGASATYPRMRSFRDYMVTFGFFADTLGADTYMVDPRDHEGGRKPLCAQNSSWVHHRQYPFFGYGNDGEYFVKVPEAAKEQE